MPGPWEKYKAPAAAGPWVAYSTPGSGPKPPSGFATPGAERVAPIAGGPDDLGYIARKESLTIGIQAAATRGNQANSAGLERQNIIFRNAQELATERAKRGLGPTSEQAFGNATTLRKELDSQPAVKAYKGAIGSYASAMQAADTPAGDLNVVYAYAKTLDPDSVVREGEQASVAGLGSIGEQVVGRLRQQFDGQGRLAPALRRSIIREMSVRVGDYNKGYNAERARYRNLAQKEGVRPDAVVGQHLGDAYAKIENRYWRGDENRGPQAQQQEQAANAALAALGLPTAQNEGGAEPASGNPSASSPSPAPMSPMDFQSRLQQMLQDQRPQSEILQFVQQNGSALNERDQGVLGEYEKARAAGQQAQVGVRVAPETSAAGGLIAGAVKPLDRAAQGLEWAYNAMRPSFLPESTGAGEVARARRGEIEGAFGKLDPTAEAVGGVLGTLPLMSLPGGPMLQGAAAGALSGNSNSVGGVVKDAAVGGVLGKAGDLAVRGAAGLISPALRQSVTNLNADKVRLTPGRMFGGRVANMEDRLTSLPLVGPRIRESQAQAFGDFQRARGSEVLGEVGEQLPSGIEAGQPVVKHVRGRLSDRYEGTTAQISAGLDPTFQTRLNALPRLAERQGLPAGQLDELNTIIQRDVGGAFTPRRGMFGGREYKRLDERLGDLSTSYRGSDDPYQRQLGDFVGTLNDQVGALVRRQNPAQAADLRALDRGWAKFARLRDATGRDVDEGIPTLGQWQNAVRAGDKSVGKGRTAEGDALFQAPVSDASEVLGSKFGNSGTADREAATDWKAWLAGAALSPLYGQGTQRALQSALTASRPAAAKPLAEFIKSLPAGTVLPSLFAPRF